MSTSITHLGTSYLTFFFLFGQSSVDPRAYTQANLTDNSNASKKRFTIRIAEVIPSLFFGIAMLIAVYYSFHKFSVVAISFDLAVYSVFISCTFSTCLLVLFRTPILGHRSQCLWIKFIQYERFVVQRLQIKMTYDKFRKRYNRKIFISLMVFLLVFAARIMYKLSDIQCCSLKLHTSVLILITLTALADFQILFYINLLGYMLENVNHHIVDLFCTVDCGERNRKITATLKDYKMVYYKLWQISQLINDNFGWILMSLLMQKANGTVQSFYWVIVESHEGDVFSYPPILSK